MSSNRKRKSSSEDSDSEEERTKRDIKERDEFANRLKAKDESKVRKINMPTGSGAGMFFSFLFTTYYILNMSLCILITLN